MISYCRKTAYNEYGFVAWDKEKELKDEWKFDTDVVTANTTLYAKWQWHIFTITFNSNGGSAVLSQTVNWQEASIKPNDLTRDGYVFVAWFRDEGLTHEHFFDGDYGVIADMTLYAGWCAFDTKFKITGLTIDNYPNVDGSTSTAPLNTFVACKLLDIIYIWTQGSYSSGWGIQPYFKDNPTAIRSDLDKSSMAYKLYELLQTEDGKRVIGESGYLPY